MEVSCSTVESFSRTDSRDHVGIEDPVLEDKLERQDSGISGSPSLTPEPVTDLGTNTKVVESGLQLVYPGPLEDPVGVQDQEQLPSLQEQADPTELGKTSK